MASDSVIALDVSAVILQFPGASVRRERRTNKLVEVMESLLSSERPPANDCESRLKHLLQKFEQRATELRKQRT